VAWPIAGDRGSNASLGLGVELIASGREEVAQRGPVGSVHEAELLVAPEAVERLLARGFLKQVAAEYWRFLGRISLGLLRVRREPDHQSLVLLLTQAVLLRFRAPRYTEGPGWAEVAWQIDRGLLVARAGRGRGSLRIRVERGPLEGRTPGEARLLMRMEVTGYHPRCRGDGRFAPLGAWIYGHTQAQIHRLVLRGFMRSLAGLEFSPRPATAPVPAEQRTS
jgi:hypothetical protein